MVTSQTEDESNQIVKQLKKDERLGQYVDKTLHIPQPYHGSGTIRLIVLGQDPTVKERERRKAIRTVLTLDEPGPLSNYLESLCNDLEIQLSENVYATNLSASIRIPDCPPCFLILTSPLAR